MATTSFDKPASKAREFISPSDLTFSWDGCHRCLWLNYNHGVKAPLFMPLVGELSAMQEAHFDAVTSALVTPELPSGKVHSRGGWVKSTPIVVNGSASPYAVRGKYDLLMEFDDGTWGVIDCKFQGRDSDKSDFYSPQLEAYAYSLENPHRVQRKSFGTWITCLVTHLPYGRFINWVLTETEEFLASD